MIRKLELYIHIPFCAKKCAYCDFLSAPAGIEAQREYLQALRREIRQFPDKTGYEVSSVFFGGGTPSLLPAKWIAEIMELLGAEFCMSSNVEISIECNPGTADAKKLGIYRTAGINRISFGLQSADNEELRLLGRIHTWEDFLCTYEAAKAAGFTNINVDLMSALPGQTVKSWRETLEKVLDLKPQHISAYSLIIEEGTPFYERYAEDAKRREDGEETLFLPSEEAEREMYRLTEELLSGAGMHRYEISNYALPGYECRHNIGYWDGTEYVGFGLGASSMLGIRAASCHSKDVDMTKMVDCADSDEVSCTDAEHTVFCRVKNTEQMEQYLQDLAADREIAALSEKDRMEEFMFLGLRMMNGVSKKEFKQRFHVDMESVYGAVLKRQKELGLLAEADGRIFLTNRGIDVSNAVMAEFLLDE